MPLFWLSLAFLTGVVLGKVLDWPGHTWLILVALSLVLLLVQFLFKRFNTTHTIRLPSLPPVILNRRNTAGELHS